MRDREDRPRVVRARGGRRFPAWTILRFGPSVRIPLPLAAFLFIVALAALIGYARMMYR